MKIVGEFAEKTTVDLKDDERTTAEDECQKVIDSCTQMRGVAEAAVEAIRRRNGIVLWQWQLGKEYTHMKDEPPTA